MLVEHPPFELVMRIRYALALALALASCSLTLPAVAASFSGTTVAVADGDTLTVLKGREEVRVRLAEIDAPEKRMDFGQVSKRSLSDLCYRKRTEVHVQDVDRYGRVVGRVTCEGIDANRNQVRNGMAWVYDRYARDRSLYTLQAEAQQARRGLWNAPSPIKPWDWRQANR
ncbi:thermonuclease family protein [Aromatoleum evansii]|uniref:thermonuclease family protein n=1 Tax=Aromatoleum evansii TaxID=59406 RepID=UPI001FE39F21|nr:thermonuclease family protein [Aromatoleum evansii]